MEKIVTKIGDVTIERRVSKPQHQTLENNLQQTSLPPKLIPKTEDSLPQYNLKEAESPPGYLKIALNNIQSENFDLKKPAGGSQPENNLPNSDLELLDGGVSLPKVGRFESAQKQSNPVTINQSQPNGPDLSKYVGISIERKKRNQSESQTLKNEYDLSDTPPVSITKIPSFQGPPLNLKTEEVLDEDLEESFEDEEDFEDEIEIAGFKKASAEEEQKSDPEIALIEDEEEDLIKKEVKQEPIKQELENEEEEEEEKQKDSDINDLACTDLVELMQKGEIEGEIEDVKDEEIIDESDDKKEKKRKTDEEETSDGKEKTEDDPPAKKKKKKKTEDGDEEEKKEEEEGENEDGKDKNIDKSKVTNASLRKNIREVMDETKLDEATLAAQRQEAERLKRLQEQQRIIREVQRQIALNRQNQKCQNKVLSLLQGNSQTSILKTSSVAAQAQSTQVKNQNSVLVKLSNGEQTSLNNRKMLELLKNSKNKTVLGKPPITKTLLKQGMVTPSVSIAPIAKKEAEETKKKKDVVTLSSDSEDDCIVLSDDEDSEPEEDPTNSGMHTNDKYNLPDEKGRVVVNVGHPESETDLYLAPQIARIIKPHQIGGIRFLYDNVIESIERFQTSTGFGCILAHSMGLGKTLQIVSFSDIFLRYTSAKTILCIMPINTIQNWLAEFNMWLPKESTSEDVRCREFDLFIVNESLKNINARAKVILDWHKSGGVLLMGYELFRLLSLKKSYKSKKKKKDPEEEDAKQKELIEEVYSALVVPGPDLVICDEGHRIKNSHATTSQALKQIRTKRRIVLTGYPLQNNLLEYWCMVDFVRPNYLGTKTEFSNMFERPIQNGQCIDSTPQDKRLMRYRAHVLHSLLEGFVQRRSHAVLQSTLPEKEEYVLLLRFTPFQRKLYDTFMNEVVRTVAVPNPLKAFAVCCKIWNHPDVLYHFLKKKGEEIDLDLEEALPPSLQIPQYPYIPGAPDGISQPPTMPGGVPWPKRGPGSRGGKSRQTTKPRVGRGRKPAASIPPNVAMDKGPQENDTFNSGQYPSNENFSNQSQSEGMDNFQNRGYNQNPYGYSTDYTNQAGGYSNSNYNKNPLNNLENMSANAFQNKRFFPHQNETGTQNQYRSQNFDSGHSDATFNPNSSNESNLNSSFDSNLNSSDSNYNQNESTKSFDFNQDFSSEFYSGNSFSTAGNTSNFSADNKTSGFQNNPFYQNTRNFDYQAPNTNMNSNFQNYERSSSTLNYPNNSSNFQGSNTIQRVSQTSGFQSSTPGNNFHETTPSPTPSFQTNYQNSDRGRDSFMNQNSSFNRGGNFQGQNPQTSFQGGNYDQGFWSQSNWGYPDMSAKGTSEFENNSTTNNFMQQQSQQQPQQQLQQQTQQSLQQPQQQLQQQTQQSLQQQQHKFNSFEEEQPEIKEEVKGFSSGNDDDGAIYDKKNCDFSTFVKTESDSKYPDLITEESKGEKPKEEEEEKKEDVKVGEATTKKDDSLPYEWATELFKTYVTGVIENSSKMEVFFHIVTESIKLGDRLLVFSQSLLTLDLIEDYLHRQNVPEKEEVWAKNRNYFRLDGSTPGLEREKLINEFNGNPNVYLFLVSTRAGSLGINLVGANRVVVFDASWNPCHDTQAVCRVYRYGQRKPCFVYRLVMDSCLEKKIYDRQVNKQGMADRVVDELNPDAHLSIKEVTNLCWDDQEDTTVKDFSHLKNNYNDQIIQILLERCSKLLSKEPFQHESLLIDRKEKKLSQAEKRLAKRSYELEKQAANQPKSIYSFFPNAGQRNFVKPIASVRPMQSEINSARINPQMQNRTKWIPAEVWQKQGMTAQEMTLPLDVVIPTSSPEKTSIVLKAGQRVMVLKSPKGIYMQLENGKIIAIRSAFKVGQNGPGSSVKDDTKKESAVTITPSSKTGSITVTPKVSPSVRPGLLKQAQQQSFLKPFAKGPDKKVSINMSVARSKQVMGKAKPFVLNRKFESTTPEIKQKLMSGKINFGNQEKFVSVEQSVLDEKTPVEGEKPETNNEDVTFEEEKKAESSEEKTEEKPEEKSTAATDSLETLRKVTESITESTKRAAEEKEKETKYPQMNSLMNYRHNFTSQVKSTPPVVREEEKKNEAEVERKPVEVPTIPTTSSTTTVPTPQQQQGTGTVTGAGTGTGTENVQNWLMNQSYPPMDPYGNYFPGYYAYGPGPGHMMPPYDGFYSPSNYGHPVGRNPPPTKQQTTENPQPTAQPQTQNSTTSRNPSTPIYPPYPNPYPYPYNYPGNFNNQGLPFPNQSNQSAQQQPPTTNPTPTGGTSSSTHNQQGFYDNSMYSAFHRPDAPFQTPDNSYPSPYPRPPYPSSGTPGFFPYNHPYPNYPYGPNFNPYMGYGYPMQQNHPPSNSQSQNPTADPISNSNSNSNANR